MNFNSDLKILLLQAKSIIYINLKILQVLLNCQISNHSEF